MSSDPAIVRGPPTDRGPDGSVPIRMELGDLKKNNELQWNLYFLGLAKFMDYKKTPESDALSWYQVSGIHGLPYVSWPDGSQGSSGYCTHNSILFLPWHRPYCTLYEQTLYQHVQDAAAEFSDAEGGAQWRAAAKSFRAPYWDWALPKKSVFPDDSFSTNVSVVAPGSGGKPVSMPNPLYQYKFQSEGEDGTVDDSQFTFRYGNIRNPKGKLTAAERQFHDNFDKNPNQWNNANLTERVLYILQSYLRYGSMSNDAFQDGHPETYGSMEGIHDVIHTVTGGDGNMSSIPTAAFDPIFWLHHINIDRMFSIWIALHGSTDPSTYVEPEQSAGDTFQYPAGTTEDENTPLEPFKSSDSDFWTAKDVKQSDVSLAYAYPETQRWKFKGDTKAYRQDVINRLGALYPGGSVANTIQDIRAKNQAQPSLSAPLQLIQMRASDIFNVPSSELKSAHDVVKVAPHNKYLEWIVNIKSKKHALERPYSVHVFLGGNEVAEPLLWPTSANHVGIFSALGQNASTGCGKCQTAQASGLEITGQVPLTVALMERYVAHQIPSMEPNVVIEYLKKNLHWRVASAGREVDRGSVDGLVVSVISNEVTIPEDPHALPIYAPNVHLYPQITTKADGQTPRGNGTGLVSQGQA